MKRFVVLLVVLVCIFSMAYADHDVDLSNLTKEQLFELRSDIDQAIGHEFASGWYLVGEDIPAGSYIVKTLNGADLHGDFYWYASKEDALDINASRVTHDQLSAQGKYMRVAVPFSDMMRFTLEEGNYFFFNTTHKNPIVIYSEPEW